MTTLEQLKVSFGVDGEKQFEYLNNKNRGGVNNSKGNTFENFFTVYQIAIFFNTLPDWEDILFSSQAFCFIDDLVIELNAIRDKYHFQIKDVEKLSWTDDIHAVKDDFTRQYKIGCDQKVDSYLYLVVSRKEVYDHLVADLPNEIKGLVKVIHFETASSLNNLIRKNPLIKAELGKMCALENPSVDKLDTLGAILLGSWDSTDKNRISLKELLDRSRAQNPNFIRGFGTEVSKKLSEILKSIAGFCYTVESGYLNWRFNDTDDGVLKYCIGSFEYEQWENDVFNTVVITFEDLEPLLAS